jgi:subtilisin
VTNLPAWSEAFVEGSLGPAPSLAFEAPITREWAYGDASGRGVKVAVIDSGIDAAHPRVGTVERAVVLEYDADAEDGIRRTEGPHDDLYGHGTACAGIIRLLAPEVELFSVRVLGARLTGKAFVFAAGVEWCLEQGVQVVNLSLSTANEDYLTTFHELCDAAAFQGTVLVSALNNERKPSYPSEFSSVFSVAATNGHDVERFSCNPRPPAEWGAPGIDVEVAWLDGGTIVTTGNSFAAPVIAGHVARILGAHPGLKPYQVKTVLAALADNA